MKYTLIYIYIYIYMQMYMDFPWCGKSGHCILLNILIQLLHPWLILDLVEVGYFWHHRPIFSNWKKKINYFLNTQEHKLSALFITMQSCYSRMEHLNLISPVHQTPPKTTVLSWPLCFMHVPTSCVQHRCENMVIKW